MIHVPFVDLKAQYESIREEIQTTVDQVLESGWYILGDRVRSFEQAFASYCGGGEAIGVGSGTDALHIALHACGVGPGDEVVTVANTFIATVLAIDYTGATPILVDIDPNTYNLDVTQVEQHLTPRTKAILPVHLFGQPADLDPILELARRHELYVVEDACQAHGAQYQGQRVGIIGDMGCFSFYPTKNLGAYGDGGLIVTRRPELAERARLLRNYGQTRKYYHQTRGFNSRLDEVQAAVLETKLAHLDSWNEARRRVAARYNAGITHPLVTLPHVAGNVRHVYHLYVIRTRYRDELARWLLEHDIHTQIHYPVPIHLQQAFHELLPLKGTLPVSEALGPEALSLPMYPELADDQIDWVIQSINGFPVSQT